MLICFPGNLFQMEESPSLEFLSRIICPYFKLWGSVGDKSCHLPACLVSCFPWKRPLTVATLVPWDCPVLGFRLQVKISHSTMGGGPEEAGMRWEWLKWTCSVDSGVGGIETGPLKYWHPLRGHQAYRSPRLENSWIHAVVSVSCARPTAATF